MRNLLSPAEHSNGSEVTAPCSFVAYDELVLVAIKLLHTLVWAILAGSIVVLPFTAVTRRFRWTVILTALVLLECGVLALNGGRCPLSDVARHFTADRADNFDIYLPNWLARYNKQIFGALFIASELVALRCWFVERFSRIRTRDAKSLKT